MYETIADIQGLIFEQERESYQLEFKSGERPIKDGNGKTWLGISCSAFANAGGGVLIYGIAEKKGDEGINYAACIEPVQSAKVTEDSLTQHIANSTEPPLRHFTVTAIPSPIATLPGKVFVIKIEQGTTAHQFNKDGRYYRRVGATTDWMLDYEIRDVMNRRILPSVNVSMQISKVGGGSSAHRYIMGPVLENLGSVTATHWALELLIPHGLALDNTMPYTDHSIHRKSPDRTGEPYYECFEITSERTPGSRPLRILPNMRIDLDPNLGFRLLAFNINDINPIDLIKRRPSIKWRLYLDNCPMQPGEIKFDEWAKELNKQPTT